MASGLENIETIESPFRRFVTTIGVFPTAFTDAMTYYECLAYLVKYMEDTMIPAINENAEAVEELQGLYIQLKTFVDTYFENLDVQDEINNKLDQMVEDGTLQEIINSYLQPNVTWTFNTVAELKASTNLVDGGFAKTLGYYTSDDGGGAYYKISENEPSGYYETLTSGLYAELEPQANTVNVKQFGAYGDDTHDDYAKFASAVAFVKDKAMNLYIPSGKYLLSEKLVIDWSNSNFWQDFDGSYSLKGAGIYETILHFTSADGLDINPDENILSIEVSNFSIENEDYDPLTNAGNARVPASDSGVGLKCTHIGYTGHVNRIGVRGFYIGFATRKCYNGPLIENMFVNNCVFGYSSKQDTSIEHSSCSYCGLEACYVQESNSIATLTNIICEGNLTYFMNNTNNQRTKFEGRGFVFMGGQINMFGCYTERLFGNARYVKDSKIVELNGSYNNNLDWLLRQPEYSELNTWMQANSHNYDDYFVNITSTGHGNSYVKVIGGKFDGTAHVDVYNASTSTYAEYARNVIFEGFGYTTDSATTYNKFYKGNSKPIVKLATSSQDYTTNYEITPDLTIGNPVILNTAASANYLGRISMTAGRKGSFTNTAYDRVNLQIRHTLDGAIRFYRQTSLNGTEVESKEVITIASDGKVTFPQN